MEGHINELRQQQQDAAETISTACTSSVPTLSLRLSAVNSSSHSVMRRARNSGSPGTDSNRFTDASIKGWVSYLGGDPAPANALIKKDNPEMTDDKIAFAIDTMKKYGVVGGGDAPKLGFGAMTNERWLGFYKDMADAGGIPQGLAIDKVFTLKFVNKKVGMT